MEIRLKIAINANKVKSLNKPENMSFWKVLKNSSNKDADKHQCGCEGDCFERCEDYILFLFKYLKPE